MKIGIAAGSSTLGTAGGVDVYIRSLIEALADHDAQNQHVILLREKENLVAETALRVWSFRQWPRKTRFVTIYDQAPTETRRNQFQHRLVRKLGRTKQTPPRKGETYRAWQMDRLKLDLIHFPRTAINPLGITTPAVLTFFDLQHEYLPEFFTPQERTGRTKHFRAATEKARHIIAPSEFTKQTLAEKYAIPPNKVSVVPVGIDRTFRRADDTHIENIRAKYDLPEKFLYYPANTWGHKNHQRLFQSLRVLRDQYGLNPNLVLTGRLRGEFLDARQLAEQAGVADCVIDLGFVPYQDSAAIFSAATMLVFPSLFEGFGIPLIEAMACGCPIAAANTTAIPECVQDSAALFDPLNINEMANAIRAVLGDDHLQQKLVAKGLERVKRFHWDRVIPELLLVYRQCMIVS